MSGQNEKKLTVFCGNANPELAQSVCQAVGCRLGRATVGQFQDGETMVEVLENVRGADVFLLQSICHPVNDHLMELVILADALRRASVASITAVIPYFGYSRQDRRVRSARVPISAKIIADMLEDVGISRVVTVDLHSEQIQGFFSMPVDNIYSTALMLSDMRAQPTKEWTIVSPDVGGVMRARAVAKRLGGEVDLAIVDKRRIQPNQSEVMSIIGDVKGKDCVIVDDIIDTGGTLCQAAKALKSQGAKTVSAYCTHAVLSSNAVEHVMHSELDQLVITDSIPLTEHAKSCYKIRVLKLDDMLSESIQRIHQQQSLRSMFE